MATPAEIVANLPLSPYLHFESDRNIHKEDLVVHGTLVDEQGIVRAYLREHYDNNLHEGLLALKSLENHGISVARHLPFIAQDGFEMLLVENVDGLNMNKSDAESDVFFNLAAQLGHYTADCLIQRERLLTDIYHPFQYNLRAGIPVLVDLDMHLYDAADDIETKLLSEAVFEELREDYRDFLPHADFNKLDTLLVDFHKSVLASIAINS